MTSKIRVRFAPSPTGALHVGGARTALFNYYFAKSQGGDFLLRIEDTDKGRSLKEHEVEILNSMSWLGMKWSEEPVYQSQNITKHQEAIKSLIENKQAYRCTCTSEEVEEMREAARKSGKKPRYDGRCRDLNIAAESKKPYAIRFKVPLSGECIVVDQIKGDVRFDCSELDDFVIARSDQTPTYQLAVVVDDINMGISHIIRGDDHLNNSPKQQLLWQALSDTSVPVMAHLPVILGPDKKKLSKRHGAAAVSEYKAQGYLSSALVNALMRLGWGKGDQEIFDDAQLTKDFSLEGCGTAPSVFDAKKLLWFNKEHLKTLPKEEVLRLVNDFDQNDLNELLQDDRLYEAVVQRANYLGDLAPSLNWLKDEDVEIESKDREKILSKLNADDLRPFVERLDNLEDFKAEKIWECLKTTCEERELKIPQLAKPVRLLVTGTLQSPDLSLVCEILGKELLLKRLKKGLI